MITTRCDGIFARPAADPEEGGRTVLLVVPGGLH